MAFEYAVFPLNIGGSLGINKVSLFLNVMGGGFDIIKTPIIGNTNVQRAVQYTPHATLISNDFYVDYNLVNFAYPPSGSTTIIVIGTTPPTDGQIFPFGTSY